MKSMESFKGCLLGGAVGDALGYPVEFYKYFQIKNMYGEKGITEYKLSDGKALISDDTQMTLFTANGLLLKKTRAMMKGIAANYENYIYQAYLDWLDTKTTFFSDSMQKKSYRPQPDNISPGDVIWVEFGINIGAELSDYNTKGHYAVVVLVSLGNLVVIPLTSKENNDSLFCFDLGYIPELSKDKSHHSYLKLDAIRSISKRRVGRMSNKENGKVTLSHKMMNKISKAMKMSLLNF